MQRGVRMTVIVPGARTDQRWVRLASRRMYGQMLEAGVRIFEYQPGMTHVKALLVDDLWAVIGTTNLDNRSFEHNDEVNVAVRDTGRDARGSSLTSKPTSRRAREITLDELATPAALGKADRHGRLDSRAAAVTPNKSQGSSRLRLTAVTS